jgi:hypothetical protein
MHVATNVHLVYSANGPVLETVHVIDCLQRPVARRSVGQFMFAETLNFY